MALNRFDKLPWMQWDDSDQHLLNDLNHVQGDGLELWAGVTCMLIAAALGINRSPHNPHQSTPSKAPRPRPPSAHVLRCDIYL